MISPLIGELFPKQPSIQLTRNKELQATVEQTGLISSSAQPCLLPVAPATGPAAEWCCLAHSLDLWDILVPLLHGAVLPSAVPAQAGWLQPDFGLPSVFCTSVWNHLLQHFLTDLLKWAPASWWNHTHFQSHVKPHCFHKDQDINMYPFFFIWAKILCVKLKKQIKKVHVIQPSAKILLDWIPSLAASLLPVVYLLFCYSMEKVSGLGLHNHLLHPRLLHFCAIVGSKRPLGPFLHSQVPRKQLVCVGDTDETDSHAH